jgi:hypothetical protein
VSTRISSLVIERLLAAGLALVALRLAFAV